MTYYSYLVIALIGAMLVTGAFLLVGRLDLILPGLVGVVIGILIAIALRRT